PAVPIRVSNLRLNLDEPESALPARLARVLGLNPAELTGWRILRKSLDARRSDALQVVYTAEVGGPQDEERVIELARRARTHDVKVDRHEQTPFIVPPSGAQPLANRPVIVGSGPAGLVAGYFLAEQGYRPLLLERGRAVRERIHDVRAFDQ